MKYLLTIFFLLLFINNCTDSSTNPSDDLKLSDIIIGDWFPSINEDFSRFEDDGIGFGPNGEIYDLDAPGFTYEKIKQFEKELEDGASYTIKDNNILIVKWDSTHIDKWEITIIDNRTLRSNYLELYPEGGGPKYMKPIGLIRKVTK